VEANSADIGADVVFFQSSAFDFGADEADSRTQTDLAFCLQLRTGILRYSQIRSKKGQWDEIK
jgi:hypothetical protein